MGRRRSPSPTAATSAPCSTATACARARYYVTDDDLVIMASEVGCSSRSNPSACCARGACKPGRMFLVDFEAGAASSLTRSSRHAASRLSGPTAEWLERRTDLLDLVAALPESEAAGSLQATMGGDELTRSNLQAFGYTARGPFASCSGP